MYSACWKMMIKWNSTKPNARFFLYFSYSTSYRIPNDKNNQASKICSSKRKPNKLQKYIVCKGIKDRSRVSRSEASAAWAPWWSLAWSHFCERKSAPLLYSWRWKNIFIDSNAVSRANLPQNGNWRTQILPIKAAIFRQRDPIIGWKCSLRKSSV